MSLNDYKKIYFIGLGGIGVSAVAKFFKLQGSEVSGSDVESSEITTDCEKIGIKFLPGHHANNVPTDANLIVYSDAVPQDNLERLRAAELGIQQMSYAEILGEISKTKRTIAVSGAHGKSTVTAMIGLILEAAGFDPMVIVGSKVKTFPYGNLRLGKEEWLVVEGDEWRDHMLHLHPEIIVINNLEWDHPDYFENFEQMIKSFKIYLSKVPSNGRIVIHAETASRLNSHNAPYITFSANEPADYIAKNRRLQNKKQFFDVYRYLSQNQERQNFCGRRNSAKPDYSDNQQILSTLELLIPGIMNMHNALAATACALSLNIPFDVIAQTLQKFTGLWRRLEIIGQFQGATIISDYAHHPTAVKETIAAAREFYPNQRIVAIFQPHHRNRTKKLFNDFLTAFDGADFSIISEIYDVAGRELKADENVRAQDLVAAIGKSNVIFGGNLDQTLDLIKQHALKDDIILIMGAGDIDKMAKQLILKST